MKAQSPVEARFSKKNFPQYIFSSNIEPAKVFCFLFELSIKLINFVSNSYPNQPYRGSFDFDSRD